MLEFKDINVSYENKIVFSNYDIDFKRNYVNFIMGKSGIGKTTLLNEIVRQLIDSEERISVVFQEDRLIPFINVYKNLEIVLDKSLSIDEKEERINNILKEFEIIDCKNSYIDELSGGMKQRISIARAILYDGDIFVMDEPFKGLDEKTKNKVMDYVFSYIDKKKKTAIIVTHDFGEYESFGGNLIEIA